MNQTKLLKLGKFATRIIEIVCWMGVAITLICAIACLIDLGWADRHLIADNGIIFNGVTISTTDGAHQFALPALLTAMLGGGIICAMMAMMFRYLHQVLASSLTASPFQPANVKRIERIGWLAIAVPVVSFLLTLLCKFMVGNEYVEVSFGLTDLVMGILVLCLSQFFAHGVKLENDVDGLV